MRITITTKTRRIQLNTNKNGAQLSAPLYLPFKQRTHTHQAVTFIALDVPINWQHAVIITERGFAPYDYTVLPVGR